MNKIIKIYEKGPTCKNVRTHIEIPKNKQIAIQRETLCIQCKYVLDLTDKYWGNELDMDDWTFLLCRKDSIDIDVAYNTNPVTWKKFRRILLTNAWGDQKKVIAYKDSPIEKYPPCDMRRNEWYNCSDFLKDNIKDYE